VGNKNVSLLFSKGGIDGYNVPSKYTKKFLLNVLHMKGCLSYKVHIGDLATKFNLQHISQYSIITSIFTMERSQVNKMRLHSPTTQIIDNQTSSHFLHQMIYGNNLEH
jgi:hypothetical protein